MTNDEKIAYYLSDMHQRGIRKYRAAPPIYRLLWRLGINVRPPLFASSWSLAVPFAVGWGIIFFILWWSAPRHSITGLVLYGVGAASVGVINAVSYRRQAQKLALPRWEDYPLTSISSLFE